MKPERRLGAARQGVALLIAIQMLPTAVAFAEGELQLLLPIVSAMALGVTAVQSSSHATGVTLPGPVPRAEGEHLLPQRLRIPDGYAIDIDRSPPMFVSPVDRDRIVGFDVLQRPRYGWTASVAYDEEKRGPFPGSGEVIRFLFEHRF